jgi:hypothetical protein
MMELVEVLPAREFARRYRFGQMAVAAPVVIRVIATTAVASLEAIVTSAALIAILATVWWVLSWQEPRRRMAQINTLLPAGGNSVRIRLRRSLWFDSQWVIVLLCLTAFATVAGSGVVADSLTDLLLLLPIAGSGIALRWFLYEGWVLGRVPSSAALPSASPPGQ